MKLTKQQAIEEHRKMWNWIANYYKEIVNGAERCIVEDPLKELNILNLKKKYFKQYSYLTIRCDCFCCEYDSYYKSDCQNCPLQWPNLIRQDRAYCSGPFGLYTKIWEASGRMKVDVIECEKLAEQIANLKEKEQ